MTNEKNHIDKLFADGLKNHSVTPPQKTWKKVVVGLPKKKKIIPLVFLKYAALLAGLFLGLWFVSSLFENQSTEMANYRKGTKSQISTPSIPFEIKPDEKTINQQEDSHVAIKQQASTSTRNRNTTALAKAKNTVSTPQSKTSNQIVTERENREADYFIINALTPIIAQIEKGFQYIDSQIAENYLANLLNKEKIQYALLDNHAKESVKKPHQNLKKWQFGAAVAPVYAYRSTHAAYMSDMVNTAKSDEKLKVSSFENPILTYSTGISTQYNIYKKWTIETGLYYSRLGHAKENLVYDPQGNFQTIYQANTSAGYVNVYNLPANVLISQEEMQGNQYNIITKEVPNTLLTQYFDFMEVPFMVRYKLLDKSLGISFLTGINTAFMVGNSASFRVENRDIPLGTTKNMKSVLYSSIFGIGFQYKLTHNISIKMDPSLKYALHSLSKEKDLIYKPFSFNLFTGVSVNF